MITLLEHCFDPMFTYSETYPLVVGYYIVFIVGLVCNFDWKYLPKCNFNITSDGKQSLFTRIAIPKGVDEFCSYTSLIQFIHLTFPKEIRDLQIPNQIQLMPTFECSERLASVQMPTLVPPVHPLSKRGSCRSEKHRG